MRDNEGLHLQTSNPLSFSLGQHCAAELPTTRPPLFLKIINLRLLYEKTAFCRFPKDTLPARDQPSRHMRDSNTDSLSETCQ